MALTPIKVPWTKKPDRIVPIDWSNPLTEGLEHLYIATALGMFDLVEQRYITNPAASIDDIASENGRLIDYDGTTLEYDAIDLKDRSVCSIGYYGRIDVRTSDDRFTALGRSTSSVPLYALGIIDFGAGSTSRVFFRSDTNDQEFIDSDNTKLINPGDFALVTSTSDGTTHKQRLNNLPIVESAAVIPAALTCDRIAFGGIQRSSASAQLDGSIGLAWLYNHELSEAETSRLHKNIWQLLQPRTIYVGTAAAAGNTITTDQTEAGDITAAAITSPRNLASNQTESGDTQAAVLDILVQISAAQNEVGDTQAAAIVGVQVANITASQAEEGDAQAAALDVIVTVAANQAEAGDAQVAAVTSQITATIAAGQTEVGDTQAATLLNLVQILANQNEAGDTQVAGLGVLAQIVASQTEAGDTQSAAVLSGTIILELGRVFKASLPLRAYKAAIPIRTYRAAA